VYLVVEAVVILPAALILPVLLFVWYRRGNREAGWLILPSLFPAASAAILDIGSASIYSGWGRADFLANPIPLGPVSLQTADLGDLLFLLAIAIVMFFRFTRVSREQARAAAELEAAQKVQSLLVHAAGDPAPGWRIGVVYYPAGEVGGDFYNVQPLPDGAALIVVGDVSGKGVEAALRVAAVVGALRETAADTPASVLQRLNGILLTFSQGGFTTCLCARIAPDGSVTVANAGHLPPYRNGEETPLPPSLPLGITPVTDYAETTLTLNLGETLTFLSDGVVEACNATGELFGFDRTRQISAQSAEQIARAAQAFGQQDDITVLTLQWSGAAAVSV
jgi:serine phosphatase RsbU (regulator of sigma subunit)